MSKENDGDPEELALDFLEQWLAGSGNAPARTSSVADTPKLDPALRAIEHIVTQHKELFRRHARSRKEPT